MVYNSIATCMLSCYKNPMVAYLCPHISILVTALYSIHCIVLIIIHSVSWSGSE